MRVTPRLPVHGTYAAYPYVEMRYIRFQESSLPAALIFRLLEEVAFQGLVSVADSIRRDLQLAPALGRRLIELSLNSKVPEERVLLAWNSREDAVRECVDALVARHSEGCSFIENITSRYRFQPLLIGEEAQKRPGTRTFVYWDEGNGTAVLLYPAYSLGSFTVPPCGHIHLVAELFRKAREVMKAPMSKDDFIKKMYTCLDKYNTAHDLSSFVFQLGEKAARFYANVEEIELIQDYLTEHREANELERKGSFVCQLCTKEETSKGCNNWCICLNCSTATSLTALAFRCPICKAKIASDVIKQIQSKREDLAELKRLEEVCECNGCLERKPLAAFSCIMPIDHKCWLCDECLKNVDFGSGTIMKCPHCLDYFHRTELQQLRTWKNSLPTEPAHESRDPPATSPKTRGFTQQREETASCWKCKENKPRSAFTLTRLCTHSHALCNDCIITMKAKHAGGDIRWACCEVLISAADVQALSTGFESIQRKAVAEKAEEDKESTMKRCILCSQSGGASDYTLKDSHEHSCQICDSCHAAKLQPMGKCAFCEKAVNPFAPKLITCANCRHQRVPKGYQIQCYLTHNCTVCNSCILSSPNACASCKVPYTEKDVAMVACKAQSACCSKCTVVKPLADFTAIRASSHAHWLCDACILLSKTKKYNETPTWICCETNIAHADLIKLTQWQEENQASTQVDISEESKDYGVEERCQLCSKDIEKVHSSFRNPTNHACKICDRCYRDKLEPLGKCIFCSQIISSFPKEVIHCLGCSQRKKFEEYDISCYMEHSCRLCNSCFFSSLRGCIKCSLPYSDKDTATICSKAQSTSLEGQWCACGNLKTTGKFSCPDRCMCSPCHLVHILLNQSPLCPTCNNPCSGKPPTVVHCSNCSRDIISTRSQAKLTVSGICAKGHILCQHCVKVEGEALSCPLCSVGVEGKPVSELRHAQRNLFLACYCEQSGEDEIVDLPCRHAIHARCRTSLSACRICHSPSYYSYQQKEEETIWKFAYANR